MMTTLSQPVWSEPDSLDMSHLLNKHGKPLAHSDHFKATHYNGQRKYIPNIATDTRHTLNESTRKQIIGLARHLYNNSSVCRGAVNTVSQYSIADGLSVQSLSSDHQSEYEDYFNQWASVCDSQGRLDLAQIQYLSSISLDRDGDVGVHLSKTTYGYPQITLVESHRICNDYNDDKYSDGYSTDKFGKVVSYKIKQGDKYRKVAPRDFILLSDPSRADMVRGLSALTPCINTLQDIDELIEFEVVGTKLISAIGCAITTPTGEANDGSSFIEDGFTSASTGGLAQSTWSAGMIPHLSEGEDIKVIGNRPSPVWQGFMEYLISSVSIGLGMPSEFYWSPKGLNGPSMRMVLKKAEHVFLKRQRLIASKLMRRLYTWVIADAIKQGKIPSSDDWYKVQFIGSKMPSIDLTRDAQQNREDIRYGVKTLSEISAESGKHWEDVRNQSYKEADNLLQLAATLAKEHDITKEQALDLLSSS